MLKIYYFSAPWCGPCKTFGPLVEHVCRVQGIELEKVNISTDEGQEMASNEGIRSVPTIILAKNGMWQDQRQGAMTESSLLSMIADHSK